MKIQIDGRQLPLKNLDTARLRDIAELQQQTGWKLSEIRSIVRENETWNAAVLLFLTQRSAGFDVTWDEVCDRPFADIVIVREPGDIARSQQGEEADPPQPSGDSAPDGDAPAADQPAKARFTTSSSRSRGSKTRSTGA